MKKAILPLFLLSIVLFSGCVGQVRSEPASFIDWENMTAEEREAFQKENEARKREAEEEEKAKFGFICSGASGVRVGLNILTLKNERKEWCCDDSDGEFRFREDLHYYIKGAVEHKVIDVNEDSGYWTVIEHEIYIDSCDGDTLTEWICAGGRKYIGSETFKCPNGCEDGACIYLGE